MNQLSSLVMSAYTLINALIAPCWASPITVDVAGKTTQQERFIPGVPPGTPWWLTLSFDDASVIKVRDIQGYNATFYVHLITGQYGLGTKSSPLDGLWMVVFDNSVGGGDELDLYPEYGQIDQLIIGLAEATGLALSGLELPNLRTLALSMFDNRIVVFDEDSPLVSGQPGGGRQATLDYLSVTNAVPEPNSLALSLAGLWAFWACSRNAVRRNP